MFVQEDLKGNSTVVSWHYNYEQRDLTFILANKTVGNLNVNRYLNITQDKILETILDLHELEEYLTNDWFL